MRDQNRVVIAGMGLYHSQTATGGWHSEDVDGVECLKISDPELAELLPGINVRAVDRQSIFAGIAVRKAIAAYLELGSMQWEQTGVVMGSTFGAITSIGNFYRQALREGANSVSPMEFPNTVANAPASRVGMWFQFKGPNVTLSDGLVSGLNAVGYAYDEIRYQKAKCYIAGDTEGISDNLLRGYAETFKQCSQGSNQIAEVIGEGAGGLYLCSGEAALAANYQVYAEIAGFYSGGSRQIFEEVDFLLAENAMSRKDTVVYTSVYPYNQAAVMLLDEARQRFGPDQLVTPNRKGDQSFQYFGLNGIIDVMQAAADLKAARHQKQGALIIAADWDERFAVVLLKNE
jgi:hypothetical protein